MYQRLTKPLKKGPRLKRKATHEFEKIIKALLDPNKSIYCSYNYINSLEITIDGHIYDLSAILSEVDFEHLELNSQDLQRYINLVKEVPDMRPNLNDSNSEEPFLFPTPEDYLKRDTDNFHSNLSYAEKLALTYYSNSGCFTMMNNFLRTNGIPSDLANKEIPELTREVKKTVLAIAIASHGLSRYKETREASDDNSMQTLWRLEVESVESLNEDRNDNINDTIPLNTEGFTSTTDLGKDPEKTEEEHFKELSEAEDLTDTTVILIQQPRSLNPIGTNISRLSGHENENEVLFPPRTQLKYDKLKEVTYDTMDKKTKVYTAVPVRSIDTDKKYKYSSADATLRCEVLRVISKLNKLKSQDPQETIEPIRKIIKLYNNILTKEINSRPENSNKSLLLNLKSTLNTFYYQLQVDYLKKQKYEQLKQEYQDLLPHIEYVYNKHLSKEFRDTQYEQDLFYPPDEKIIPRPNHGLPHTLRVALYVPEVINYFAQYTNNEKFKRFCADLLSDKKEINKLQIALLFFVTGRESEVNFKENEALLRSYREQSYRNFCDYARSTLHWSEKDIEFYRPLIEGNNALYRGKYKDEKTQFMFNIIDLAHNMDLMRCFGIDEFKIAVGYGKNRLTAPSEDQQVAFNSLLKLANDTILYTGDRLLCSYDGEELVNIGAEYDPDRFIEASTSPSTCYDTCLEVQAQNYQVNAQQIDMDAFLAFDPSEQDEDKDEKELLDTLLIANHADGHQAICDLLLKYGADPHIIKVKDNLLRLQMINHLDEMQIDMSLVAFYLFDAIKNADSRSIQKLITKFGDPIFELVNECHESALHLATKLGHLDILELLLKNNSSNINDQTQNTLAYSPLHYAVAKQDTNMINLLLTHNANPFESNIHIVSPFDLAIKIGDPSIISQLLLSIKNDDFHESNINTHSTTKISREKNTDVLLELANNFIALLQSVSDSARAYYLTLAKISDTSLGKIFDKKLSVGFSTHSLKQFSTKPTMQKAIDYIEACLSIADMNKNKQTSLISTTPTTPNTPTNIIIPQNK